MTTKGKSPAFSFYANDWLGSTAITLMTPEQEGAYIRLLAHAWSDPDCGIPDNDIDLAILSRLGERWFNVGSTVVKRCFTKHPTKPGYLVNLRLLKEREKQAARSAANSEAGRKSAAARGLRKPKSVERSLKSRSTKGSTKFNLSSSSSSSFASSCSSAVSPSEDSACAESCTEPPKATAVLTFPTAKNNPLGKPIEWHLTNEKLSEYAGTFPTVNVLAECRKAWQWIRDNPAKRKTIGGMPAFLTRWLTNAAERGGRGIQQQTKLDILNSAEEDYMKRKHGNG